MRSKIQLLIVDLSPIDGTYPSENTKFRKHAGFRVTSMNKNGLIKQKTGVRFPFLKGFNLGNHQFLEASVIHKDKKLEYFWLHLISDWRILVDYPKSKFNLGRKNVLLNSYEDYMKYERECDVFKQLKASKVKMKSTFKNEPDMFFIGQYNFDVVISDKLKIAIIENNITGVEIIENKSILF